MTPTPEPPTPLTDARWAGYSGGTLTAWKAHAWDMRDFARTLERRIATLTAERDEARSERDAEIESMQGALTNTLANISDTCRVRGFEAGPSGTDVTDRVIALAQAFDQLRAANATLSARVEGLEADKARLEEKMEGAKALFDRVLKGYSADNAIRDWLKALDTLVNPPHHPSP